MSILIKGVNMPQNETYLDLVITADGNVCCYDHEGVDVAKAVELPDHGDLIEKDYLIKRCDAPHWCVWLNEIEDAPVVIPAER